MVQLSIKSIIALTAFAAVSVQGYGHVGQKDGCVADQVPRAVCENNLDCCSTEECNGNICDPKSYYGCSATQNAGNICDQQSDCCSQELCTFYSEESETGICELNPAITGCKPGQHSAQECTTSADCCSNESCMKWDGNPTGLCEPKDMW
ncbi:hypothetical protein BDA99DRAFT_526178 [Phascolomyces articulosus]|uniref:Uncharacterized protein n=1 Tax=Phascolomyces articulosus TaxID=60185 RepID=A0AAD5K1Q0_9FUNG|nr:hypothetical protein BDA99DRAFT_526178 [Phascolomyces articulosus]